MREPDDNRFAELLLYVSEKCANDPTFGATKLNKILFYSDFLAYAYLGDSITGFEYQKLDYGHAPRRVLAVRNRLMRDGSLSLTKVPLRHGKSQERTIAERKPRTRLFNPQELEVVDRVIASLRNEGSKKVSSISHSEIGWQVARLKETIPYGTIFLSDKPLTDDEIRRIQQFAEQHGYATR